MIPRAGTPQDAPMIADLWNDMIRNSQATFTTDEKPASEIVALIHARPGAVWILGGGFVTWGPFRSGPGYAHTVEHTIIAGQPGQGTGRALLSHGLRAATAQGHRAMVAAISGANLGAQVFHARHGFAEVGRMPQVGYKAGHWLDLVLMQKILNSD